MEDIFANNLEIESMNYKEDESFYYVTYNLKNGEKHNVVLNKNLHEENIYNTINNFYVWREWPLENISIETLNDYLQPKSYEESKVNKYFEENKDKVEKVISDININVNYYYRLSETIRLAKYCSENGINLNNPLIDIINKNMASYEYNLDVFKKNLEFQLEYISKLTTAYNKYIINTNYLENIFEKTDTLPKYNCYLNNDKETIENLRSIVDRMDPNNAIHIIFNEVQLLSYDDLLKYEARKDNVDLDKVFVDTLSKTDTLESETIKAEKDSVMNSEDDTKEIEQEKIELKTEEKSEEKVEEKLKEKDEKEKLKEQDEKEQQTLKNAIYEFAIKVGLPTDFLNDDLLKDTVATESKEETISNEINTVVPEIGESKENKIDTQEEVKDKTKTNENVNTNVLETTNNTQEQAKNMPIDKKNDEVSIKDEIIESAFIPEKEEKTENFKNISFSGYKAIDSDEFEEKELKHEEKEKVDSNPVKAKEEYKPATQTRYYKEEFDRILNRQEDKEVKKESNKEIEDLIKAKNELMHNRFINYEPYDYSDNYFKKRR